MYCANCYFLKFEDSPTMKVKLIVIGLVTSIMVHLCTSATSRLSLVDWNSYNYHEPSGPGTYAFGYDIDDPATNNVQFRNEERHPNGSVTGSYGYVEPDGNVRLVHYIADHNGYRAREENTVKLSMLKPIRYPDTPFYFPGLDFDFRQIAGVNYPPSRRYFPRN